MIRYFRYLFSICENKEKYILILFGLLAIIAALFETVNISALIPLINSIVSPAENIFDKHQYFSFLENIFSVNNTINYLIIFLLIFLIKVIYLISFNWFVLSFLKKVERRLTKKLFETYINQPLNFFFKKKTSEILRNLTNETAIFRGALQDAIELFVEIILIFFVLSLLLFISFKATILIIVLVFIISLIYINATKKKIAKWANDRILYLNKYYQNVIQTFRLITEVKIFNVSNLFSSRNSDNINNLTDIIHFRAFIKTLPKLVLETVGVIFFVLIIFMFIKSDSDINDIVIVLGVFLASSIRIISSSNKLLVIYQNIKNSIPSLKIVNEEIKLSKNIQKNFFKLVKFDKKIILKNIDFSYSENKVFENLNLEINKNSIIGIFGKSGQGKSTLIRIVSSLLKPSSGKLIVDDKELKNDEFLNVSIIPQEFNFFEASIKDNITFTNKNEKIDQSRLQRAIESTQLQDSVLNKNRITIDTFLNNELKNFSGGQLQRIALSRAIYKNSDLLILDEATSALDHESEDEIMRLLDIIKKEKTIIIISHNQKNFKNCDIVYELKNKKIIKSDQ